MLGKNDIVQLKIEDMTEEGEGIGRAGGYPLFVKDAVIGDCVEALVTKPGKSYGYARVNRLLSASPDRVTPACPAAAPCGGCQLQALSYPAQLRFKENKVRQHLIRLGGIAAPPMLPILGMDAPLHYRNKAQYPVGTDKDGKLIAGFYAGRSHRIVPVQNCGIGDPADGEILRIILEHAEAHHVPAYDEESGKGLLRHVLIRHSRRFNTVLVCLVINGRKYPAAAELVERLCTVPGMTDISLSVNTARTNVILGSEILPLFGPGYLEDSIGELIFRVSPLSFFQVNPVQTEKLYRTALDYAGLTGAEDVWDLYCGTGTIGLFAARSAGRVCGVEIVPAAVENARANAQRNHIGNASFFLGAAEEVFPRLSAEAGFRHPDTVFLDPPRKGCGPELLDALTHVLPERIVYVSCNSASLARDLKILLAAGYRLEKVQPVDMFPQTVHIETVCLLVRKTPDAYVRIKMDMEDFDLTKSESKATYEEIKAYVKEQTGLNVTHLDIAQTKRKSGIIERENYNLPKSSDAKQPKCTKEKEDAIIEALKHFQMV